MCVVCIVCAWCVVLGVCICVMCVCIFALCVCLWCACVFTAEFANYETAKSIVPRTYLHLLRPISKPQKEHSV